MTYDNIIFVRTPERAEKVKNVVEKRQEGIIVLEDIHDPHNAQAVIRSCDCFGFHTVYIIFENERQFNPTKMGKLASSSANKWLDYKYFTSTKECYEELKKQGYETYATILDKEAKSIYDYDFTLKKKIALVFGNEHAGISEYAAENADNKIYIPMHGMIQSLNLSVTAAISMFEVTRQRKERFSEFKLEDSVRETLYKNLLER